MASPQTLDIMAVTVDMTDISTAGSVWVPCPTDGRIVGLMSIISAAITGTNTAITLKKNGVAVTGAALTITQSGSAAGDVDSVDVPMSATAAVVKGDSLEVISDGASSTTSRGTFLILIARRTGP